MTTNGVSVATGASSSDPGSRQFSGAWAFANIVRGVAINADKQVESGFFDLLNPYATARRSDHRTGVRLSTAL